MRIAKTIQIATIILVLSLIATGVVYAATTLEVGIPGTDATPGSNLPSIPMYIKYLYLFVLGFVGIAGFASLVFWGAVWTGSGIIDKKRQAIDGIKNTLTGIGIALTAFILLYTINPDLTVIKAPSVAPVNINSTNINSTKTLGDTYLYCKEKTTKIVCNADARCGWAENSSNSWCTSTEAASCYYYTTQYERCYGNLMCQKDFAKACGQEKGCEFTGDVCVVRISNP